MKKLFYILIAGLLAAVSCQQMEIVENPQFSAFDDNDNPVLVYGQSLEKALEFGYFQYSKTANTNNEVAKTSFFKVKSNCAWKIVPEGNAPDWVRPYPEEGDKDGFFGFFLDRNNDQTSDRSAIFKVTLNNGQEDIPVGGYIIITQSKAVDFLKVNVAKIEVNKEGGKSSVTVTSNVPWTFTLTPDEGYASPAIDQWIQDISEPTEGNTRTIKLQFADNSDGSIRGATLAIKATGHDELSQSIPVTQYGVEIEVAGFPVSWPGAAGNNGYPLWPSATNAVPTINSTEGKGTITFIRADIPGLNRTASTTDCSGSNPRVNGAWPGDYWLFTVPAAVSAGSLIKLQFEGRISGSGIRHWRLEYEDGNEWKIVGTPLTADLEADATWPAETITYTHDMAPGGSDDVYNKIITAVVRYENTTPEAAFRFVAASNVIASSGERMSAPTAASVRLDNSGGETGCDASISCVASGGEIKYADIDISGLDKDYILFEGTPAAPATFTVEASDDFTVTTTADWLTVTKGATGLAAEPTTVEITCAPSTETKSREAQIIVTAGVTRKYIAVIQGAAGGELDPLISVSGGNSISLKSGGETANVKVQANVEVSVEDDADWLEVNAVQTKSMVESLVFSLTASANTTGVDRTAKVRFYNEASKVESILTVSQNTLVIANFPVVWSFKEPGDDWVENVDWGLGNPSGSYVYSDTHEGKLTVVRFGPANSSSPTYKNEGNLGVRLLQYGVALDDYWLFEVDNVSKPAGTYTITYSACSSAAGAKFFMLEYSLDGSTWTAVNTKTTHEALTTGDSRDVTYTYALSYSSNTANEKNDINESFHLPAIDEPTTVRIRARVCDTMVLNRSKEMNGNNHGGTNRIGTRAELSFVAD